MSKIFQIAMKTAGGRRMVNAFKSVQAAIILKLACEGAGLVHVEFTKAVGESVRAFANLLEHESEDNYLIFAEKINDLMKHEDEITKGVIDAVNRLEKESETEELDKLLQKRAKGAE